MMDNIFAIAGNIISNLTPWVAALWLVEKALEAISVLTPWKWDDNIGIILGKILKALESVVGKMVKK
jgi:hypothetical protein